MSYTLRGRIESRLAALVLPLAACCAISAALHRWWPLELCALMVASGSRSTSSSTTVCCATSRAGSRCRSALLELTLMVALVRALGIEAPLVPALVLFAAAWAVAQALGQAGFPLLRLSYADRRRRARPRRRRCGRGRARDARGRRRLLVVPAAAHRPPRGRRAPGAARDQPPRAARGRAAARSCEAGSSFARTASRSRTSRFRRRERDRGRRRADTVLDGVTVSGSQLDGIHVRRSAVTIRNCTVDSLGNTYAQGIDISYASTRTRAT